MMLQTINGIDMLIALVGLGIAFLAHRHGEAGGYCDGYWMGYERGLVAGKSEGVETALTVVEDAQAVVVAIRARRGGALYDWEVDGL